MTRRRPSIFVLGVCTGTFLLLFGVVIAEASAAASEKSDSQKTPTPDTTTLRVYQNQSTTGNDGRNVDSTKRKTHDGENGSRDSVSNDESTSRNGDKSDVSMTHSDANSHATKSREESDSSSLSDGNRKPRHGEIAAENSGKSTSTKAVLEDLLRFSRTNELTAATTKPALNDSKQDNKKNLGNATLEEASNREGISDTTETAPTSTKENIVNEKLSVVKTSEPKHTEEESPTKYEEKGNATVLNKEDATAVIGNSSSTTDKSMSEDAKLDEKKEKIAKSDYTESISKTESRKENDATSLKENAEDRDRELTTIRGLQHENSPEFKRNANDIGTTASEAFDLEKIDEKEHEGTISLINDTYVNYNHFYKTLMGKDSKDNSVNQTADTNDLKDHPKTEVEVVKNVTHLPPLKIVITANDTAKNDSYLNKIKEETIYVKQQNDAIDKHRENRQKEESTSVLNATLEDNDERRKLIGKAESQVKLPEITTQSTRSEEHSSSIPAITPSPVPQGRTIGFSEVNKFPSTEVKSTTSTKANDGFEASLMSFSITPNSQNGSKAEKLDQKPYPYVKSNRESFQTTTTANLRPESITEETSAYENTIGRGESEKKFIVTEPSVVIENSIQQQKSDEKSVNKSINSTMVSSSPSSTTTIPTISAEAGSTNGTLPERFNGSAKVEITGSNGNDVPGAKEEEKVTARRDEGYDVTGNGITEVSLAPDGKAVKSHSDAAKESSTSRSTVIPLNTDVQMEPEEAMMIRSTLDVTESTIVPLGKDVTMETNNSTTSMTPTAEKNTEMATMVLENSAESTTKANMKLHSSSSANQTSELPSTTLNPDESSVPTTTSIEFEFIGLTEAISSTSNATERSVEGRTFEEQMMKTTIATSAESSATNNATEDAVTTMKKHEESTELPATTEDGTPTTNQISITYHADNETSEARDMPVTQITLEDRNNRTESASNEITVNPVDFTSTGAGSVSGVTENPSGSKNTSYDANVTETFAPGVTKFPPNSDVTTLSSATNAIKNSPGSFSTSTLEPRVLWSTPVSTESPDEDTTDSIQPYSPEEITLVKIVIEGTLHDICPRLQDLRKALADVLTNGMDKLVLPKQIIIHQNPCPESANSSPTPMDVPLTSILVYVVDGEGKFDVVMTKILPSLYKVSPNFPVRIHKFLLVPEADSGNAIAVVVVSSVAFICLVLLAGLLFIMRKRQTRFNYGERCRPVSLDAYSLDSVSAYNSVRRKGAARASKRSYGNPTFEDSSAIPSHPLNFAGLSSFCNDVNAINEEFTGIPQVSAKIDELPPGAELKNRYANVIPLPETRVPLQKLNNDALTEYINASYVRGPKNATKYYIGCQAPMESTVTDFWRMIWEQQCKVIIMLTDLVENGVEKCTEYIPPSEVTDCHRLYGDFQVTLKKRETKEKYAISTLHLKNLENNTFREVFHIWYLWPVSGVQSDGAGLIAVLLEARALQRGGPGPIVVHCSPGTGRTGTLIALDLGIRQYEITRTVDVPRVVYTIRRDRAGAVQTKEQYAFIYKALNLYATKLAGGVLEST